MSIHLGERIMTTGSDTVFFVTGSSRGLGRSIARAVVAARHPPGPPPPHPPPAPRLAPPAAARRSPAALVAAAPDPARVLVLPLDVASPSAVTDAVDAALA